MRAAPVVNGRQVRRARSLAPRVTPELARTRSSATLHRRPGPRHGRLAKRGIFNKILEFKIKVQNDGFK